MGQEKPHTHCTCNVLRLVSFFLFLTAICSISDSFLLVSTNVGITWPEKFANKRHLLRRDNLSHSDSLFSNIREKHFCGLVRFGNPAFGGRGACCFFNWLRNSNGLKRVSKTVAHDGAQLRTANSNANACVVAHRAFDSTLGFPGEGWSKDHAKLKIGTWNTRSLTYERFDYCKSLQFDVLAITELWRNQQKYQDNSMTFIVGEANTDKNGNPRYPNDRAAGVGIILSQTAQQKVLAHGKLLAFAQQERQNPVSAHIMWTPAHPIAGEVCFVDLSQIFPVLIRILPISANGD